MSYYPPPNNQYGYGGPMAPAARPKRKGYVALTIGLVLFLVVGPIFLVLGITTMVSTVSQVGASLQSAAGGPVAVQVEQGQNLMIFQSGSASPEVIESGLCKVSGPDGQDISLTAPSINSKQTVNGQKYELAAELSDLSQGSYTVNCDPSANASVYAGDSVTGNMGLFMVLLFSAFGVGFVGLIVLIIGIVRLISSGKAKPVYPGPYQQYPPA